MSELSIDAVAKQLETLGVQRGAVLLVHTSFKAARPIENGPLGLIRALQEAVGPEGTLVMPTMTDGETVFDPATTPTRDMGITAELFWRQPGVHRSTHPGGSFAAKGPHARAICEPQVLSPPHGLDSPVGRVYELHGQVLLIGVTHSEDTTLHLAESIARVPYSVSHPTVISKGQTALIAETDHCCTGFRIADAWLRSAGLQREGKVGHADARLARSADIVELAVRHLAHDPLLFLCAPTAGCEECDAARASVQPRA